MNRDAQNTRWTAWILRAGLLAAVLPLLGPVLAAKPRPAQAAQTAQAAANDPDKTLAAMHDEMERSRTRLISAGTGKALLHRIPIARF